METIRKFGEEAKNQLKSISSSISGLEKVKNNIRSNINCAREKINMIKEKAKEERTRYKSCKEKIVSLKNIKIDIEEAIKNEIIKKNNIIEENRLESVDKYMTIINLLKNIQNCKEQISNIPPPQFTSEIESENNEIRLLEIKISNIKSEIKQISDKKAKISSYLEETLRDINLYL